MPIDPRTTTLRASDLIRFDRIPPAASVNATPTTTSDALRLTELATASGLVAELESRALIKIDAERADLVAALAAIPEERRKASADASAIAEVARAEYEQARDALQKAQARMLESDSAVSHLRVPFESKRNRLEARLNQLVPPEVTVLYQALEAIEEAVRRAQHDHWSEAKTSDGTTKLVEISNVSMIIPLLETIKAAKGDVLGLARSAQSSAAIVDEASSIVRRIRDKTAPLVSARSIDTALRIPSGGTVVARDVLLGLDSV